MRPPRTPKHLQQIAKYPAPGSGVRARGLFEVRIALAGVDAVSSRALIEAAGEQDAHVFVLESPKELLSRRAEFDVVACRHPVRAPWAHVVEHLVLERTPVIVLATDVRAAVAAYGISVPLLVEPVSFSALLEQSLVLMGRL